MFLTAQRAFGDRVHAIGEDQWHATTPCDDWDVTQLVDHLIDENQWVPPLMHGLDLESANKIVQGARSLPVDGGVGANLTEVWDGASLACADAFREDGGMERTVALSRGPTPATGYITEMIFDHLVHAWDLEKAIGYRGDALPDDLAATAYEMVQGMGDLSQFGDMFKPAVSVPDDAPIMDKLIGLTGRDPNYGG